MKRSSADLRGTATRPISRHQIARTIAHPDLHYIHEGQQVAERHTSSGGLLRVMYVYRPQLIVLAAHRSPAGQARRLVHCPPRPFRPGQASRLQVGAA